MLAFSTSSGAEFGYDYDGWKADGSYHYTGEGQVCDQKLTAKGNAAILNHRTAVRAIRLFDEIGETLTGGKIVRYVGEFALDEHDPYYRADALDREKTLRSVIVFRLYPVDPPSGRHYRSRNRNRRSLRYATCPSNPTVRRRSHNSLEPTQCKPNDESRLSFSATPPGWRPVAMPVCSTAIRIPGTAVCLYADLYDQTDKELIEAKGTATRVDVRLALGQVLDYARFVDHARLAVLLPEHPGADLVSLLADHGVATIYETSASQFGRDGGQGS